MVSRSGPNGAKLLDVDDHRTPRIGGDDADDALAATGERIAALRLRKVGLLSALDYRRRLHLQDGICHLSLRRAANAADLGKQAVEAARPEPGKRQERQLLVQVEFDRGR